MLGAGSVPAQDESCFVVLTKDVNPDRRCSAGYSQSVFCAKYYSWVGTSLPWPGYTVQYRPSRHNMGTRTTSILENLLFVFVNLISDMEGDADIYIIFIINKSEHNEKIT